MVINEQLHLSTLKDKLDKFWILSGQKIISIEENYDASKGSPVFTVAGKYTTRGWTEWTQGFQYGSSILQFEVTGDERFLNYGRSNTLKFMAPHISHIGVHDHGFNNISTYGNLHRLMVEGKLPQQEWEKQFYIQSLKISGAIQAARWTSISDGGGFIHSFNGPHSLFVDTIRSCRSLMVSYLLGHQLQGENDVRISLLTRGIQHMLATAKYVIYYGSGRDAYDVSGRTAHEAVFNTKDGNFRCPNSQQGYSGFTTWTRGLAWAMCGFAEQLEFLNLLHEDSFDQPGEKTKVISILLKAAKATSDFFIANTPTDGIPYWDTGAPNLYKLGDYLSKTSDPYNEFEPIDASAAAIACQGLFRLGTYLDKEKEGKKYWQAGLTVMNSLLNQPYISEDPSHQGLLLHTIYHRPNGWDYVPKGSKIPNGESCMWGDYHIREVSLYLHKIIRNEPYYTYFNGLGL